MTELTPIRIEKQLKQEIKSLIEQGYFSTMTEFVKDAIRKNLAEYRKQQALIGLAQLQGKGKGIYPTREQRAEVVNNYITSKRDIFKEFGLE